MTASLFDIISQEIGSTPQQVQAAAALLDEGSTVPFIARYRKEATGGLDDTQLRALAKRIDTLRALEERRGFIRATLQAQGTLSPALDHAIASAQTRTALEDLYAPHKPKKTSKAKMARAQGLQPLADQLRGANESPEKLAKQLSSLEPDVALSGARDILVEEVSQDPVLLASLRHQTAQMGMVHVRLRGTDPQAQAGLSEAAARPQKLSSLPGHRLLGLLRAAKAGTIALEAGIDEDQGAGAISRVLTGSSRPGEQTKAWLEDTAHLAWKTRIAPSLSHGVLAEARDRAVEGAIDVFARNLRALLLAPPAGAKVVMGIDPGIRTGIKVAVVDPTGKLLETQTLYPFAPRKEVGATQAALAALVRRHQVDIIAVGSGTGGRETLDIVRDAIDRLEGLVDIPQAVLVSEAGASVYSASEDAAREFPHLDVTLRGAVSIARRTQDPLAELVKIEPRALGVGQYQHDLPAALLDAALAGVVEDAVSAVGVDVNTASAALLSYVPGVGPALAAAIVAHRDANGPFSSRAALRAVPRLGPKAFEQCAGFLRVTGREPLDATGIHPESYPLARTIIASVAPGKTGLKSVWGKPDVLSAVHAEKFVSSKAGLPTIQSILDELARPGRDPRGPFKVANLDARVREMSDLVEGMHLEGTVTNVAAFGAFVDIGVHQDGLVHISQMSHHRISDPHAIAKVGDTVRVQVLSVDIEKKRISLSMRSDTSSPKEVSPIESEVTGSSLGGKRTPTQPDRATVKDATGKATTSKGSAAPKTTRTTSKDSVAPKTAKGSSRQADKKNAAPGAPQRGGEKGSLGAALEAALRARR